MKKLFFFTNALALIFMAGCSDSDEPGHGSKNKEFEPIQLSRGETMVANNTTDFAFGLIGSMHKQHPSDNVVLSPLSAEIALSMVANGMEADVHEEIVDVLGFAGLDMNDVNSFNKKIANELILADASSSLALANSIWIDESHEVLDNFKSIVSDYYGSEIYSQNRRTFVSEINAWCNNKTNGTIKEYLDPTTEYKPVNILNAIYFKGMWQKGYKFDIANTKKHTFKGVDGEWNYTDFMNQKNKMNYCYSDYAQMCALPFGNGAFSMNLILPNEDVDACLEKLSNGGWREFTAESWEIDVRLSVPKFTVTNKHSLIATLKAMGLNKLFDREVTGIATEGINIDSIDQMVYFEMDEEGVKASAVTSIGGVTSVAPPQYVELTFDRPFIYAITEKSTGVILFVGVIDKL